MPSRGGPLTAVNQKLPTSLLSHACEALFASEGPRGRLSKRLSRVEFYHWVDARSLGSALTFAWVGTTSPLLATGTLMSPRVSGASTRVRRPVLFSDGSRQRLNMSVRDEVFANAAAQDR